METAIERRPTYQWPTWKDALVALSSACKGQRPRLAKPSMWREPGDRPPETEDFVKLRVVLASIDIVGDTLVQLTRMAKRRRELGDLRPARLRLERGLRRHGLTRPSFRARSMISKVTIAGAGETHMRTTHVE